MKRREHLGSHSRGRCEVNSVKKPEPFRIGLDLVLISRVKASYDKSPVLFVKRFLSDDEAAYCLDVARPCRRFERFAGRIAAKEAVMKVLGKGWPHVPWTDIEIVHDESKRPLVRLKGKALAIMGQHNLEYIQVSITHDGQMAAAVAIGIPRTFGPRDLTQGMGRAFDLRTK